MQHEPQISGAWNAETADYDYLPCFQYITPYWQKADYVIANLETTSATNQTFMTVSLQMSGIAPVGQLKYSKNTTF